MRNLDETIELVEESYVAFQARPAPERTPGVTHIKHIAVYGRATTNVLQNLRGVVAGFDEWYAPIREWMEGDPLMKYFYKLRTRILKEGEVGDYEFVVSGISIAIDDQGKIAPGGPVTGTYQFGATPTEHKGQKLDDLSVEHLVWLYWKPYGAS
jgi:hypothetical protein